VSSYAALRAQTGKDREVRETLQSLVALYTAWGKPGEAERYRALRGAR
jgi:hypothetical protein